MVCSSCGRATKAGARFCGGCGASLAPRCPACGVESEPETRFCEGCGASLAASPASAAVARKVVSIVFADLIGSTALHERLDPESVSRIMEGYHASVRVPIETHGGTVVQLLGDGVMCAFGIPRVAEDDALRAVRAAVEVQRSFREFLGDHPELTGRVGLRVAVNTGEVVVSDDYAAGIGDPLNVAARLQQEAKDGDVLIGEATQRLVAERVTLERVGSFALKGRAEPVTAYRVVSLERPAGAAAVAFVGRDDELRRLTAVYDSAIAAPAARMAVLLGSPGLGKSRLLHEFARRLGEQATVLAVQCVAGAGATFAPLAEALRAQLRVEEDGSPEALRAAIDTVVPGDDAERAGIAAGFGALLAGAPALPEETFFVLRRLLAALATKQPLVLVIDDLQWASPLLLDFTEHLVQWGADVPLLALAAARLELRDVRSGLTTPGGLVSDVVTLGGLDAGAAMRLAANVIGADTLPAAVAGKVLTASEGNPLFVGELVRMLVNDGALRKDGERWSLAVDLAELEMPPTIHALLAARIERLRPEERLVLERAAVVGRQFSRAALTQLLPREAHADLDARFEALRRSELIEADTGWLLGEPALRFHHGLIRDAAYRRVLRGTRAELHGRFADWLESRAGGSLEHDETIGWHLEQAHQHLRELAPLDANGRALGERAARYLAAAGRRALARDDLQPAASVLGRALACLGEHDPARGDLAVDWCEALLSARDVGPAARALDELGRFTAGSERLSAWHACFTAQLAVLTDPKPLRASAAAVEAAAETLAAAGDTAGEAKAHWVQAIALARLGQGGAGEAALDKALAAARRVGGDRRRANEVLSVAPLFALWGPSPVTRASGRCLDVVRVLRITQGAPAVEAVALRCQAVLEALRGRSEAARRMIASSRRMVEELGITQRVLEADVSAGRIELLEGDAVAAERWLSKAYDGLRERGLGIDAAQAAALLGRALLAEGRVGEAEALSHESEALAGDDLKAAIAWRGVRAEALARRGEHTAAIDFAKQGVEIAAATDGLLDHADARLALAVALRAAGQSVEAQTEETRAIELWEQKGATLLVERARRGEARSAPAERAPDARVEQLRPERSRLQANAATAHVLRLDAVIDARDADAVPTLFTDQMEAVDHITHTTWDRQNVVSSWRSLALAESPTCGHELLATLGDSLALCRMSLSASRLARGSFDVGSYEKTEIHLIEADAPGPRRRTEVFGLDRLGDAVARLYERYAELLPEGPARTRAVATARSVAALSLFRRDVTVLAPEVEFIDHRTVGVASVRGAEALEGVFRALHDLTETWAARIDDILGQRSDALLIRWTNSGTLRAGGGAYERHLFLLTVFGDDGLVERWEQFDAEQAVEALARFEALTAARPEAVSRVAVKARRRVGANAATEYMARSTAAITARDADAFSAAIADPMEYIDHPLGAVWGREGALANFRAGLKARDLSFRHEPIATLGDSLALGHRCSSASGGAGKTFDVGPYEREAFVVIEADERARVRRTEAFAADRLGDAIARLYERYAELLPDGPERVRAAATARSVAASVGPYDLDRYKAAFARAIEAVDHRTLGTWSARGAGALLDQFRSSLDLTDDAANRGDEVLGLRSDAFLERRTHFGTLRAGGGAYERQFLSLSVFGTDGLLTRIEWFDADRDAEALARFDELTAARPARRRVRPNAATVNMARVEAATAARDADAFESLLADDATTVDHKTGAEYDRPQMLRSWRSFLTAEGFEFVAEPLATLGESFALYRNRSSARGVARGDFDVGAYEREEIVFIEVDAEGRRRRHEILRPDRLGNAIARLYERHAERLSGGPGKVGAAATARSVATMLVGPYDTGRYTTALAPAIEYLDHRTLGFGAVHGAEGVLRVWGTLLEVAAGVVNQIDDVLGLEHGALLWRGRNRGMERVGGGVFERLFIAIHVYGADGLLCRAEFFDADRDAEALARFDELTAEPPPARLVRRRVRPNAATANATRLDVALAERNVDALPMLLAEDAEVIDRTGATYGRSGTLDHYRRQLRTQDLTHRQEPLATLGDSLALCRLSISGSGAAGRTFDVGAFEFENVTLVEVDAHGRRRRLESFAADRLGDAITRLYERYAELLPEGPARARAAATARSFAAMAGPFELDGYASVFAPAIESVDHRILGTWSTRGAVPLREHFRAALEVADDIVLRDNDILGLQPDAFLVSRIHSGIDRAGGGPYERPYLMLGSFGVDGLVTRVEWFDTDREAEALARFDELTAEPPAARFANAAWRATEEWEAALERRDWDALVACYAPGHVLDDRRSLVRTFVSGEAYLAHLRFLFDAYQGRSRQLLATRGDRLALSRLVITSAIRHGGLAEFDTLLVVEVDATGRRVVGVVFDPDALDAAYAELDARYAAGEAAPYVRTWGANQRLGFAIAGRDWGELTRTIAPDIVWRDHRLVGLFELRSRDEFVESLRAMVELAPDAQPRTDHVLALDGWHALVIARWVGSREGGAFEIPFATVLALGPDARFRESHTFDLDQLDAARACFAGLAAEPRAPWIENAATRWYQRVPTVWESRNWEGLAANFAPGFQRIDRRSMVRLERDREEHLEFVRPMFEMESSRIQWEVLATRGDRLALGRYRFEGSDRDVVPSLIEWVDICEVDASGSRVALVIFDPDDLDAAYAALDERYGATKVPILFLRSLGARDWDAVAALLAPDLVVEDHRRLALWETLHGPAAYVAAFQALVELAPDVMVRVHHLEDSGRGALLILTLLGMREGGAFEDLRVIVHELDAQARIRRLDAYDLEQLEEARARFEALGASAAREPLAALVPPNAASAALDRLQASFAARDWAAVRALAAEGARFEDRRRHALVSGDIDWWIADLKQVAEADVGLNYQRSLVATAGDRVCLERVLWSGGPAEGRVEIEYLYLAEVDAGGRLVAGMMFDADERRAAQREALAGLIAGDPVAAAALAPLSELLEGYNDNDHMRMRAVLADDFVHDDHRRTGVGRIDGVAAFLESLVEPRGLVRDIRADMLSLHAIERHGAVGSARFFGTLPDGGAFEQLSNTVFIVAGGRITRIELFEIDQLDAALARFAELRPDPLRIPPNAATRARDRFWEAIEKRDWESLRALCSSIRWEDRRRLIRTTGDCDTVLANSKLISRAVSRVSRTPLATAGDRLMLERVRLMGDPGGVIFEAEVLDLLELDAAGCIVALITLDPDDRRAASRELLERSARSEGASLLSLELRRSIFDHDLERVRALLPAGFVYHDHRRIGAGRIERPDDFVAWLAGLFERSSDAIIEPLYVVAIEEHGTLSVGHTFGTLVDGGAFESVYYNVVGPFGVELFELEDLERARARFEELRPDPLRIPPNAASRARDRTHEAWLARDWDTPRAMASDDFIFEDRGKRALVSAGVELWLQSNQFVRMEPGARVSRELIGTAGDRIALERIVWSGGPASSPVEREHLRLTEVGVDGRLRASIRFDLDDRSAAFAEADARFVAGEAADVGGQAPIVAFTRACVQYDWKTARGCLADDFVLRDHRTLGLGVLGRDEWIESLRVLADLAPGWSLEPVRILAWNRHGRVDVSRHFGTTRDGGPFENIFVRVIVTGGDRIQSNDTFDVADADRALARFEELCSGVSVPRP